MKHASMILYYTKYVDSTMVVMTKSKKKYFQLRDEVIRLYNESASLPVKGRLCNADLQLIRDWSYDRNITARYDEFLTVSVCIHYRQAGITIFNTSFVVLRIGCTSFI